ncbi:MAG: hypothetical protein JXR83_17110 [Deltaproteobacteria bacterium]|nr:hypothetical protein [Deltaproteobacteria bacterium]
MRTVSATLSGGLEALLLLALGCPPQTAIPDAGAAWKHSGAAARERGMHQD